VNKELELWQFLADRLHRGEQAMLLVVAESSGSSPGRQGYKMAVGVDGELCGSIGGGVMEVNLVEQSRRMLSEPGAIATGFPNAQLIVQEHRKNSEHPSGMICSGKQTVISKRLMPDDLGAIEPTIAAIKNITPAILKISAGEFALSSPKEVDRKFAFVTGIDFEYCESLGFANNLYIIGGGHCALALSELMSKMDFHISIFDDRPELNTIEKNRFAQQINIIESYENIDASIRFGPESYVVVMTLGYASDAIVIRQLVDLDFKYFGVLGSKAKMATLIKELRDAGIPAERLDKIRTPIGLPINSRTPEEIAVSIAAEIIAVKNNSSEFKL
jgi:xanthine dehydrogenase accessory factor